MKIKKTNLQLIGFFNVASNYTEKNKGKENVLLTSIKSVTKEVKPLIEQYSDEAEELRMDNCSVDEKTKVILKDANGNYEFTVEAKKKLNKELKELLAKEIEINSRVRPSNDLLIGTLTETEKEYFSGIVISEQKTEDEEN